MADIPQTVVEKAAEALDDGLHRMHGIVSSCDHHEEARTVLAAVWPDVAAARLMLLCSQCGEQPAAMVKVGTDDGWCVTCLDNAAEPPAPVVDRDTLASALLHVQHPDNPDRPLPMVRAGCAGVLADALLASGVITDAADVRRQTAEDAVLAAADEAEAVIADGDLAEVAAPVPGEVNRSKVVAKRDALYEEPAKWLRDNAARLAREVGGDRG